jgi:hypothetical protein
VTGPSIPIAWRARPEPLAPIAVAARGAAAIALAARLGARGDEALARLRGVAGEEILVLIGDRDDLPWADGALYLGRDPAAPSLLLPTALAPDAPLPLIERAVIARAGRASPPFAVLVDPPAIAATGSARPVLRASLAAWITDDPGTKNA